MAYSFALSIFLWILVWFKIAFIFFKVLWFDRDDKFVIIIPDFIFEFNFKYDVRVVKATGWIRILAVAWPLISSISRN